MAIDSYSGFVQVTKVVLPVTAAGLIALVVLWPHLKTEDLRFRIGFAAIQSNIDGDPNLLNPRYVGTDEDNQPYAVTADIAKKLDGDGLDVRVGLELPKADITLKDGTWLVLTAENGVYVRRDKTLDLEGAVNLFHDSGYEFRTDKAQVDLSKGIAHGSLPVRGQGPFGMLKAQGFRLIDKGRTIIFTGKSELLLNPNAKVPK
ncbi:MAG: LPS export ABC transporter periplasmic protein LptC [Rhodospirillaceae bacterium]